MPIPLRICLERHYSSTFGTSRSNMYVAGFMLNVLAIRCMETTFHILIILPDLLKVE